MFSDSQAKKFVGKKWRIILPLTKLSTDDFFYQRNFMPTFVSSDKVTKYGALKLIHDIKSSY